MQIEVQNRKYGKYRPPHHIILTGLPEVLRRLGYPLAQVEIGRKTSPVIVLTMQHPPADGTVSDVPIDIVIRRYEGEHHTLNAELQFDGLKDDLNANYGLMGRHIEFTMRVRLENYHQEEKKLSC